MTATENLARRPRSSEVHDGSVEAVRRQLKAATVAQDPDDIDPLRTAIEAAQEVGVDSKDIERSFGVLRGLEAAQQPLTFTDIARQDTDRLMSASSKDQELGLLMRCMGLSVKGGFQSEILAEFHYHNLAFCKRNKFGHEKTSTLLSIMKALHTGSVVKKQLPLEDSRTLFEELLGRHSQQLPPYRVGVFTREEATAIREFAEKAFFRLYRMYGFVYIHRKDLSVQASIARVAPEIPRAVGLPLTTEVDPTGVPELLELFPGTEAPEAPAAGKGTVPVAAAPVSQRQTPSPETVVATAPDPQDDVHAAFDKTVEAHFKGLDDKLALPI